MTWPHVADLSSLQKCQLILHHWHIFRSWCFYRVISSAHKYLNGSVKEPNKFHNYETDKITLKASDMAEYIELFGSSTRDRHARRINVIL